MSSGTGLSKPSSTESERFQSLIEALVAEFQRLQHECEDVKRQLHPIPPESTFESDFSNNSRLGKKGAGFAKEQTEDSTREEMKKAVSWNPGQGSAKPATPREEEEQLHFNDSIESIDDVNTKQGNGQPGPKATGVSGPLGAKEPPPLDEDATFLDEYGQATKIVTDSKCEDSKTASISLTAGDAKASIKSGNSQSGSPDKSFSGISTLRTTMSSKTKADIVKTSWGMVMLDTFPACVILCNAITIGMSADVANGHIVWEVLEGIWIFCYFLEFVIKICVFGPHKYFCGRDRGWNWFDFTCLVVSLVDVAIHYFFTFLPKSKGTLGLLKMLRLARLLRLVRALHYSFFNELKQMLLGVVSGVRVLIWAIILLLVVVFFMGVALQSLFGEDEDELRSVPRAMFTVFRCYTDGCTDYNGRPLQAHMMDEYGAMFFFGYILSFMFVTVGIFNLIMAIFIENVVARSVTRKLHELGSSAEKTELRIKEGLAQLIFDYAEHHPHWDQALALQNRVSQFSVSRLEDMDVSITRDVFKAWLHNKDFVDLLEEADVEAATKSELFDVLDVDMGGELGLDELINGLMKLRGPITKSDIIAVRLKVRYMTGMIEDMWNKISSQMLQGAGSKQSKQELEDAKQAVRRVTALKSQVDASDDIAEYFAKNSL